MKNELQNIISGKGQGKYGDAVQKISSHLRASESISRTFVSSKQIKSEEATLINRFFNFKWFY